jgi:uncharacterized protein YhhL (DUF1145 family)
MLNTVVLYLFPLAFTVLVTCALTSLVCGLVLVLFKLRRTNAEFRHPYLAEHPWERYTLPIRASILLDYFFRLAFPRSRFWIVGHANRLLAHVEPSDVPTTLKWPIIGLWGGCFVGMLAMLVLWTVVLLNSSL